MEFSDKLKDLRKNKGITQEELANKIFVSRSVIAKYESGYSMPTQENAEKLAEFFDVKLSYLIDEEERIKMTLIEIKTKSLISCIISSIGISINLLYLIICSIPLYIIKSGVPSDKNTSFNYEYNSIISITLSNNNPIAIITLVLCTTDLVMLAIFLTNLRHNKKILIIKRLSLVLLVINIFLIIITFVLSRLYFLN